MNTKRSSQRSGWVVCILTLLGAWLAQGQGTIQFTVSLAGSNVVPASIAPSVGAGTFSLTGTELSYSLRTDFFTSWTGAVYGAAGPTENGSFLFKIRNRFCVPPGPPYAPGDYCLWTGTNVLSEVQIPDLVAGLWYVQFNGGDPDLSIRGQILPVPEPSVTGLMGFGVVGALSLRCFRLYFRKRIQNRAGRPPQPQHGAKTRSFWILGLFFLTAYRVVSFAADAQKSPGSPSG